MCVCVCAMCLRCPPTCQIKNAQLKANKTKLLKNTHTRGARVQDDMHRATVTVANGMVDAGMC